MIPKIIHYCWFGGKEKSPMLLRCLASWQKYMPDYEIKEWNEGTFDVTNMSFTKEAYAAKKYAFVSDYVRLYALYNEGGVYLDTDVEVFKSFDPLLETGFIGFEFNSHIGTAVIGCKSKETWVLDLLNYYNNRNYINWLGKESNKPNPIIFEEYFTSRGIIKNNQFQIYEKKLNFYPIDYLSGFDYYKKKSVMTNNTFCIHHYEGSWGEKKQKSRFNKILLRFKNIKIKVSLIR